VEGVVRTKTGFVRFVMDPRFFRSPRAEPLTEPFKGPRGPFFLSMKHGGEESRCNTDKNRKKMSHRRCPFKACVLWGPCWIGRASIELAETPPARRQGPCRIGGNPARKEARMQSKDAKLRAQATTTESRSSNGKQRLDKASLEGLF